MNPKQLPPETDHRFPSGPWLGFYLQKEIPGRHYMELTLTFHQGQFTGDGRDRIGKFIVRGRYQLEDGKCWWTKRYVGRHDVFYQGFNEGKGIWGTWEIPPGHRSAGYNGGFHIWPKGMLDPTGQHLVEQADLPAPFIDEPEREEKVEPVEVGPARAGG